MILRIDDTDIARNTQQSLDSIFDGLNWLELGWDEQYRQSERLDLHRQSAEAIARKGDAYDDDWLRHTVDVIRSRFFTLKDFATRGRAYFADDFRIEPDALEKLDKPDARPLLRELAGRLAAGSEFTEQSVEAELRKLAEERGVKAGLLINGARAALTGQPVGPSAFAVFIAIGRERAIERLSKV